MEGKYLHISFMFFDGQNHNPTLEPIFNNALDWYRYSPNCWLVWTTSNAEKWYERLRPAISDADRLFIVEVNMANRQGWLAQATWDWMNKTR